MSRGAGAVSTASPAVHLCGVFCPTCRARVSTVALEAGPQLIRHDAKVEVAGERRRCKRQWVAVPDRDRQAVELLPVDGRHEADAVLRDETARWLHTLTGLLSEVSS